MCSSIRLLVSWVIAVSAVLFLCVAKTSADEIILQNGDRLTGTVVKMENNVLILKTQYSQPIEIQAATIKEIRTDSPAEVKLGSGEVLKGKISPAKDGQVTVEASDQRGPTTVDRQKVAAINPPPIKWEGGITLGGTMQKGNTDRTAASAAFDAVRRGEKDRISFRYLFNYAEQDKQVNTRNHFGALKYDYFFANKWYGYLGLEVLNDRFRDVQLRTTVGPGVGYQIWEDPVKALGVEIGASYLSESHYTANPNQSFWAARLGANFRYNIDKYLVFTDQLVIFPNLESSGQYKLRNEAAISAPFGVRWAMRLAYIIDYSSDPPPLIKKTDTYWILGLQYKL